MKNALWVDDRESRFQRFPRVEWARSARVLSSVDPVVFWPRLDHRHLRPSNQPDNVSVSDRHGVSVCASRHCGLFVLTEDEPRVPECLTSMAKYSANLRKPCSSARSWVAPEPRTTGHESGMNTVRKTAVLHKWGLSRRSGSNRTTLAESSGCWCSAIQARHIR